MKADALRDEAAERALLGAVLLDPSIARALADRIRDPDAFSSAEAREVWIGLRDLSAAGQAIDPVTLQGALKKRGTIDRVGARYIGDLIREVHTSANWRSYLAVVLDRQRARRIFAIRDKLERADPQRSAEDLAEDVRIWLQLAEAGDAGASAEHERDTYARALSERGGKVTTGIAEMDSVLAGGWWPGLVDTFAARTSTGKSTILCNWAVAAVRAGTKVDLHPWELRRVPTLDILTSHVLQIPKSSIISEWRQQTAETQRAVRTALDPILDAGLKVHLAPDERGAPGWPRTDSPWAANDARLDLVARMVEDSPAQLVAFDLFSYALAMQRPDDWGRAYDRMRHLADLQKKHLMLVHQINRMKDEREDARPSLRHLRGSGDQENKSAVVMVAYQPGLYRRVQKQTVDVAVLKQTMGGHVGVRVEWDFNGDRATLANPRVVERAGGGGGAAPNGKGGATEDMDSGSAESDSGVDW